jgi:hypothetical protein
MTDQAQIRLKCPSGHGAGGSTPLTRASTRGKFALTQAIDASWVSQAASSPTPGRACSEPITFPAPQPKSRIRSKSSTFEPARASISWSGSSAAWMAIGHSDTYSTATRSRSARGGIGAV